MAATPSKPAVLSLLRSLIKTARGFSDYNVKEYVKRCSVDAFRQHKDLSDSAAISAAIQEGKSQLEVTKRQALVCSLYVPKVKSVMETWS